MRHQLMTAAIKKALPKLYATDGQEKAPIIVKFFTPWTYWTWYAKEGEPTGEQYLDPYTRRMEDDYRFFGMVHGHEKELGYFLLSELASVQGRWGLHVERDLHFSGHTIDEVMERTI